MLEMKSPSEAEMCPFKRNKNGKDELRRKVGAISQDVHFPDSSSKKASPGDSSHREV